jgi:hypothetical protein
LVVHVSNQEPYLVAFPDSSINQLVIMTIDGLNNQGEDVVNRTLLDVYGLLHTLVEQEIAQARELCGEQWHKKIHDSWDVEKNRKDIWHGPDYGWIQYQDGPVVKGMIEQFERDSWEIYRGSDVLWEEKEMLWLSSLGEEQRKLLGFPMSESDSESVEESEPTNHGYDEPWSPTLDALLGYTHHGDSKTGQASTSS